MVCEVRRRGGGGARGFLLLHAVVGQRSLMLEFKTPGVVCPVCLSYQPMLRCLLTLTSIVLIQSFHSPQRLQMGCGCCELGSRSLYCIQQPNWPSGYRAPQSTGRSVSFDLGSVFVGRPL